MTKQEIFDKVVQHLMLQGRRSTSQNKNMCAYRGVDGTTCAIGCLMDDSEYNQWMEGEGIGTLFISIEKREPDNSFLRFKEHTEFLSKLQRAHDFSRYYEHQREAFALNLRYVARVYSLDSAVLEQEVNRYGIVLP